MTGLAVAMLRCVLLGARFFGRRTFRHAGFPSSAALLAALAVAFWDMVRRGGPSRSLPMTAGIAFLLAFGGFVWAPETVETNPGAVP